VKDLNFDWWSTFSMQILLILTIHTPTISSPLFTHIWIFKCISFKPHLLHNSQHSWLMLVSIFHTFLRQPFHGHILLSSSPLFVTLILPYFPPKSVAHSFATCHETAVRASSQMCEQMWNGCWILWRLFSGFS